MATDAMRYARFDHPKHGTYDHPEKVLKDEALSESEKQTVLEDWAASLKHILANDPHASDAQATKESLDEVIERLAAGRT
ncbi:hypothetical protein LQ948_13330 [Jiella sp. MQZ9-1]|uniref:Uncharacterized protein n=1 Tax=Jiella flava TaxID=2816857 RepID=A0A939JWK9_9HYPH|nr:hypothetical protein [Jiella flava]MBO0663619.1 hypothetical protein [Jiella flava]MCD2472194.1 hypothetical protein [Jiella flava]